MDTEFMWWDTEHAYCLPSIELLHGTFWAFPLEMFTNEKLVFGESTSAITAVLIP